MDEYFEILKYRRLIWLKNVKFVYEETISILTNLKCDLFIYFETVIIM
jgi:hypothetical protein